MAQRAKQALQRKGLGIHKAACKESRSDRGTESPRSDGMGRRNECFESVGGRTCNNGML